MKFLMMLLELMPLLFRIHSSHLLTQNIMIISQYFEAVIEPLKSLKHSHAPLLPIHASYLCFLSPHAILLLLLIGIELGVLIIAYSHRLSLCEELGVSIHWFFCIESWRLHESSWLNGVLIVWIGITVPLTLEMGMICLSLSCRHSLVVILGRVLLVLHRMLWVSIVGRWLLRMGWISSRSLLMSVHLSIV